MIDISKLVLVFETDGGILKGTRDYLIYYLAQNKLEYIHTFIIQNNRPFDKLYTEVSTDDGPRQVEIYKSIDCFLRENSLVKLNSDSYNLEDLPDDILGDLLDRFNDIVNSNISLDEIREALDDLLKQSLSR